jgi:hypothetical protein
MGLLQGGERVSCMVEMGLLQGGERVSCRVEMGLLQGGERVSCRVEMGLLQGRDGSPVGWRWFFTREEVGPYLCRWVINRVV